MLKTLLAVKRSKWERDLIRYGSADAVQKLYKIQNNTFEKVYSSHTRQLNALKQIQKILPETRIAYREELSFTNFKSFDYIISLGGDNHFVYVSFFADGQTPILGINSDPDTSQGALLHFSCADYIQQFDSSLNVKQLSIENWSRIECELIYMDGGHINTGLCTSEISIRSSFADSISRYLIHLKGGNWEEQKSSGLILATGAGSTGWFRNCHWGQAQDKTPFPKNAPFFRLIARELRATKKYHYQLAEIKKGEILEVISEMNGEVSIDAHPERTFSFPPGCIAKFRLSDTVLRVVNEIVPQN